MCPQIACLKGCIITQVAFVCLFSRELWSSWRRGGEGRPRPTDWPTSIWVWVERVGPLCPKVCKLLLFHIAQCLLDVSIVSFHLKNKWDPALFSTVHFQMCLQSTCIRGCIITLVAFVGLFATVHFQMCLQMACLIRCIITLVAFVCLYSTMLLQMCPQIAWMDGCKVTLVAFVLPFSTVCLQMSPQNVCARGCKVTLVAFVWIFLHCAFSNVPSNCLP